MRVALINMPFASLAMPSLALTQLTAVVQARLGPRVRLETHYLNLDFAHYLGDLAAYQHALQGPGFMTGVGDWFFRQAAFPDAPDNQDAYFARYYFDDDAETRALRERFREKRAGLTALFDRWIDERGLAGCAVVGFTALFAQTNASFALARRLKERNPRVVTVVGGAACDGGMGLAFAARVPQIDYVFNGPALITFPEFLHRLRDRHPAPAAGLPGVVARGDPNPAGGPAAELDIDTPVPLDYAPFLDACEAAFPAREIRPVLLFETSRGCAWAEHSPCTFCGLNGTCHTYHAMGPARARAQFEELRRWTPRCPSFIAVDTLMPPAYLKELWPTFDPAGLRLMYEVRPVLSDAQIGTLCRAGIAAVQPGIEALNTHTLKLMAKGTSAFGNLRFLKACSRHPLALDWNLLIGSPGEPESTLAKYARDLPLLAHLAPPTGVYPIMFVRHSVYFDRPADFGLDLHPQEFYRHLFPFDDAGLREVAYHFVDRRIEPGRLDPWLDRLNGLVAHWRARWTGQDGRPQARLALLADDGPGAVYDTRAGEEIGHRLTPETRRLLDLLDRPLDRAALQVVPDADAHLDWLRERGLVFEEEGRYLSLVLA